MPHVTIHDLTQLGDVCNSICYHLTAHLSTVAAGVPSTAPPEVAQIFQLALKLPKPEAKQWATMAVGLPAGGKPAGGVGQLAEGGKAPGTKQRLKWTPALEEELTKIVEVEEYRKERLGSQATRKGKLNWSAVGRHFGFAGAANVKSKYSELKGLTPPTQDDGDKAAAVNGKAKKGEPAEGEKPAKKQKVKAEKGKTAAAAAPAPVPAPPPAAPVAAAAAPAPTPKKKKKEAAAAAAAPAPTPASQAPPASAAAAPTPGEGWTPEQDAELVQLVEDEDQRKEVLGKKKLRWKKIGEHFGKKIKACKRQYAKLADKEAPSEED